MTSHQYCIEKTKQTAVGRIALEQQMELGYIVAVQLIQ